VQCNSWENAKQIVLDVKILQMFLSAVSGLIDISCVVLKNGQKFLLHESRSSALKHLQ